MPVASPCKHLGAEAASAGRVALHDAVGMGQAIAGMPRRAEDVVHDKHRRERFGLVVRDDLDGTPRRFCIATLRRKVAISASLSSKNR